MNELIGKLQESVCELKQIVSVIDKNVALVQRNVQPDNVQKISILQVTSADGSDYAAVTFCNEFKGKKASEFIEAGATTISDSSDNEYICTFFTFELSGKESEVEKLLDFMRLSVESDNVAIFADFEIIQ